MIEQLIIFLLFIKACVNGKLVGLVRKLKREINESEGSERKRREAISRSVESPRIAVAFKAVEMKEQVVRGEMIGINQRKKRKREKKRKETSDPLGNPSDENPSISESEKSTKSHKKSANRWWF